MFALAGEEEYTDGHQCPCPDCGGGNGWSERDIQDED